MTTSKSEKSLWLIGKDGEVRVGDEAALAREVKRTLEGKDLSRGFMTACADLFFKALGDEYAFVPEGELARAMGAAARIHVLTAFANEVAASMEGDDDMREVEAASAWLAGALTRSVGSLVERARGCVVDDDAVRLALSGAAGELVCAVLPGERALASLSVDAVAAGLACVGDVVCGAAISVAASDDVEREALRLAESARLIAAASCDLP